jgi:hypothetical protein
MGRLVLLETRWEPRGGFGHLRELVTPGLGFPAQSPTGEGCEHLSVLRFGVERLADIRSGI